MAKRVQQDSGEERVTAKSRPMMNLIARAPSTMSSSASESPGKKRYGNQNPWSAKAEKYDRTGQTVVGRDTSHEPLHHHKQFVESSYSARYSRWDDDKAWSSQGWKADPPMDDRTVTPFLASWARTHEFQSSFSHEKTKHVFLEEEEIRDPLWSLKEEQGHSNSSLETTKQNWNCRQDPDHSWIGWMIKCEKGKNDLRWMLQKTTKNILWFRGMFMAVTMESAVFMGKNYWTNDIPSTIQKTSRWNKCSTYLQNLCLNKMRSME